MYNRLDFIFQSHTENRSIKVIRSTAYLQTTPRILSNQQFPTINTQTKKTAPNMGAVLIHNPQIKQLIS